jgi:alanyl-tRNA synthetase
MFYDLIGDLGDLSPEEFERLEGDQKIVEIWNDVFMSYEQKGGEVVGKLPQQNVDTGAGLERVTAVMQGSTNIFDTDLYQPLMGVIKSSSNSYEERHARIVADHIKTAVFMIQDGVAISNTGRGYVLRRILRRAFHSLEEIGCPAAIIKDLVHGVIGIYGDLYFPGVNEKVINLKIQLITTEMDKIEKIIQKGVTLFKKIKDDPTIVLTGKFLNDLEQTHGLPYQ